jgi:hypothetical protein
MPATDFASSGGETEKTGETDSVDNGAFLRAVFGENLADNRPVVVSFEGNPANAPGKVWFGRPWAGDVEFPANLPASANNYFSLANFRPDESGQYRRQKAQFHALAAVMLDDIGTKVAMERLTLAPSWLLETLPDNYQAGYLLREPLADGPTADRLMNAIVAAGLCDPGANGPRTRLARLPVAGGGEWQALATLPLPFGGLGAGTALFRRGTGRWSPIGNGPGWATEAANGSLPAGKAG